MSSTVLPPKPKRAQPSKLLPRLPLSDRAVRDGGGTPVLCMKCGTWLATHRREFPIWTLYLCDGCHEANLTERVKARYGDGDRVDFIADVLGCEIADVLRVMGRDFYCESCGRCCSGRMRDDRYEDGGGWTFVSVHQKSDGTDCKGGGEVRDGRGNLVEQDPAIYAGGYGDE